MDDNFNRIFDRLEAMDKRWDDRFTEFKSEFDTRMYKGNGKPAVMDSIKEHSEAIEELQRGVASAKILAKGVEETACSRLADLTEKVAPLLEKQAEISWARKNWKVLLIFGLIFTAVLVLVILGFMWLDSRIPALNPLLLQIAKKLAGN